MRSYYELLNIVRTATPKDIREAYRALALQLHPDRLPLELSAAERAQYEDLFKQINEAYAVLKDPEQRQRYDMLTYGIWPTIPPKPDPPIAPRQEPPKDQAKEPTLEHQFEKERWKRVTAPPTYTPPAPRTSKRGGRQAWTLGFMFFSLGMLGMGAWALLALTPKSTRPPQQALAIRKAPTPQAPRRPLAEQSTYRPTAYQKVLPQAGILKIRAFYAADGSLVKATVLKSSGYSKIDRAALDNIYRSMSAPPKKAKIVRKVDIPIKFEVLGSGYMLNR